MDPHEQVDQFSKDLTKLVDRYRDEYDMVYAEMVGVLHMKAFHLCHEAHENNEDDEEQE